jgi:hypothetical protein
VFPVGKQAWGPLLFDLRVWKQPWDPLSNAIAFGNNFGYAIVFAGYRALTCGSCRTRRSKASRCTMLTGTCPSIHFGPFSGVAPSMFCGCCSRNYFGAGNVCRVIGFETMMSSFGGTSEIRRCWHYLSAAESLLQAALPSGRARLGVTRKGGWLH